jgi:hypothetical protein
MDLFLSLVTRFLWVLYASQFFFEYQKDIILQEQHIIETDQHNICETFNYCFVNVAKNIGDSNTKVNENHPSIIEINNKICLQLVKIFIGSVYISVPFYIPVYVLQIR